MNLGFIFLLCAAVLFFFGAVGVVIVPNPTAWGFVALALGLLTGGVPLHFGGTKT